MEDSPIKGILCPFAHKLTELNECGYSDPTLSKYYFIPPTELDDLRLVDIDGNHPNFLQREEIDKFTCKLIAAFIYRSYITLLNIGWLNEKEISLFPVVDSSGDDATTDFIRATTKPCPHCGFCGTHYQGHSCHHISPFGGCLNCSVRL